MQAIAIAILEQANAPLQRYNSVLVVPCGTGKVLANVVVLKIDSRAIIISAEAPLTLVNLENIVTLTKFIILMIKWTNLIGWQIGW